jgi:Ca-activated chloride channel family protein
VTFFRRLILTILSGLAALAAHPAAAEPAQPVLIIVDGSGSMWGKMEGDATAKIYGVRDLLRERLLAAPSQSRIGLGSFGHRRKGDCGDVELITPIEAGGAEGAITALDQLNPKGKGPLTAAIREGAKAIGAGAGGHIILVHDNADNCSQDVCAAASDIVKSNPGLRVHVVSLGLPKPERERMQCLAATTKGLQFDATSQTDIASALTSIFEAAGLDAVAAASAAPAPAATPAVAAKGPPGLRLSASLSENGSPVDTAIDWRILKAGAPAETAPLVERKSREINETVEPGRYSVSITHGLIQRTFDVEVANDGPTVKRLALDGGHIEVAATASRQGDQLSAPVMTIFTAAADGVTPGTVLWLGREATTDLVVPSGKYIVEVADGLARTRQTVDIPSGASARTNLVLDTGRLELTATAFAGGPSLDRVLYLVFADDPAAPQGRREVARSTAPVAVFTLQAGTYYVTARHGAGEHREQVAISSGDIVKRALVLDVGKLTVKTSLTDAAAQSGRAVVTRIFEETGEKRLVGQSTAAAPVFVLGAGRYRIDAQIGMSNIRANRIVDLAPGADVAADLKLDAAAITLAGLSGAATQAAVRDRSGRVVWRSRAGDGFRTVLAPGEYLVQVDGGGAEIEKPIRVKAGEALTVDMTAP